MLASLRRRTACSRPWLANQLHPVVLDQLNATAREHLPTALRLGKCRPLGDGSEVVCPVEQVQGETCTGPPW
jgi:hypothetical protein